MNEGNRTPIDEGIIARVVNGVKYAITGVKPDGWFTPQQPLTPVAPEEVKGRAWDYPVGHNLRITSTKDGVTFRELRGLADGYDLLRAVIETRKDQISMMEWEIKYKDEKKKADSKIEAIKAFFEYPDKENDHETWLRALIEDLLVIDAATLYARKTKGGDPYAFELIDGATINRLIDDSGRTPAPPSPAYQQILKGMPAVDYSRDELIYKPRNVRTNKIYGYSPVEQIIMTVNIALRRQVTQLNYYSTGNIPEALASVPESWSATQIREFQEYWDMIIEGDLANKRKLKFIPHGVDYKPTKEPVLKDEFDEWLSRMICFAFSISPQALTKMMNRATAETAQSTAESEGIEPLKKWVKRLHDFIIVKYFGLDDVEFVWKEKKELSPLDQANRHAIYLDRDVLTENEVRAELGLDALTDEELAARKAIRNPMAQSFGDEEGEDEELQSQSSNPNDGKEKPEENKKDGDGVGKTQAALPILKSFRISKSGTDKDERVTKAQGKVAKKINKDLNSIKDEVTTKITGAWDSEKKADDYLGLIDEVDFSIVGESIKGDIIKAYKQGVNVGFSQISYDPDKEQLVLMNKKAKEWAIDRALELAKLTDSTKDMLRPTIERAISDGLTVDELAKELKGSYAFSDTRANMIARTELAFADEQGNFASWKESGVVVGKQSILGTNENHGDDDIANAAQGVIPIDEPFQSGDMMPPYHPNCMCSLIPVVEAKED